MRANGRASNSASAASIYEPAAEPKSELFLELLPVINSRRVALLDNPRLLSQLTALERRTSRAGRDSIDHPPGGHDDLANAAAGALTLLALARAPMRINPEAIRRMSQPLGGYPPLQGNMTWRN